MYTDSHRDLKNIQEEHKYRYTYDEPPYSKEVLRYEQNRKGIEYRQMCLGRHEFRIKNIRFYSMQYHNHYEYIDDLGQTADLESNRTQRNQGHEYSKYGY
ncbi:hypothetical protein D3C85_1382810 [compost metagenome]